MAANEFVEGLVALRLVVLGDMPPGLVIELVFVAPGSLRLLGRSCNIFGGSVPVEFARVGAVRKPRVLLPGNVGWRPQIHFLDDGACDASTLQRMRVSEGCPERSGRRTIGDAPWAELTIEVCLTVDWPDVDESAGSAAACTVLGTLFDDSREERCRVISKLG
jgi:hypothetical protein